jgi:hypothetical protein
LETCELLFNDEENFAQIDAGGHIIRVNYKDGEGNISIKTVKGNVIVMDDPDDLITVQNASEASGKKANKVVLNGNDKLITLDSMDNTVVLNGQDNKITIESRDNKVVVDGGNNSVTLDVKMDVNIKTGGKLAIDAQKDIDLKTGGKLVIDAKGGISNKGQLQDMN